MHFFGRLIMDILALLNILDQSKQILILMRVIYLGSSALILARFKLRQAIVDSLLNRNDIDVTIANNTGRTFIDFEIISGRN